MNLEHEPPGHIIQDPETTAHAAPNEALEAAVLAVGETVTVESSELSVETEEEQRQEQLAATVESFLLDNAELFEDSDRAWRVVKEAQAEKPDKAYHTPTFAPHARVNVKSERAKRRESERSGDVRTRQLLSSASYQAHHIFKGDILPAIDQLDDLAERRLRIEKSIVDTQAYVAELAENTNSSMNLDSAGQETNRVLIKLLGVYVSARYADYESTRRIQDFLETNPETIPALLQRVTELSELSARGIVEYPGLLELLASQHRMEGDKSVLNQAVAEMVGGPEKHAPSFIIDCFDEAEGTRKKELSSTIDALRLTADHISGMSRLEFAQRFGEHWEDWPAPLLTALHAQVASKTHDHRQHIKKILAPSVRQGRLPASGHKEEISSTKLRRVAGPYKVTGGRTINIAGKSQDMEDVTTIQEREPIKQFAWMAHTGSPGQSILRLEERGSIEDILNERNFSKYIKTHQQEKNLRDNLEAALTLLTTDPTDTTSTRRLIGVRYVLDDSPKVVRNLRRFSLQDFPGISGGSITARTRIAYAVTEVDGKRTLAVYGVFIKQDIEQMKSLPPR